MDLGLFWTVFAAITDKEAMGPALRLKYAAGNLLKILWTRYGWGVKQVDRKFSGHIRGAESMFCRGLRYGLAFRPEALLAWRETRRSREAFRGSVLRNCFRNLELETSIKVYDAGLRESTFAGGSEA